MRGSVPGTEWKGNSFTPYRACSIVCVVCLHALSCFGANQSLWVHLMTWPSLLLCYETNMEGSTPSQRDLPRCYHPYRNDVLHHGGPSLHPTSPYIPTGMTILYHPASLQWSYTISGWRLQWWQGSSSSPVQAIEGQTLLLSLAKSSAAEKSPSCTTGALEGRIFPGPTHSLTVCRVPAWRENELMINHDNCESGPKP